TRISLLPAHVPDERPFARSAGGRGADDAQQTGSELAARVDRSRAVVGCGSACEARGAGCSCEGNGRDEKPGLLPLRRGAHRATNTGGSCPAKGRVNFSALSCCAVVTEAESEADILTSGCPLLLSYSTTAKERRRMRDKRTSRSGRSIVSGACGLVAGSALGLGMLALAGVAVAHRLVPSGD